MFIFILEHENVHRQHITILYKRGTFFFIVLGTDTPDNIQSSIITIFPPISSILVSGGPSLPCPECRRCSSCRRAIRPAVDNEDIWRFVSLNTKFFLPCLQLYVIYIQAGMEKTRVLQKKTHWGGFNWFNIGLIGFNGQNGCTCTEFNMI